MAGGAHPINPNASSLAYTNATTAFSGQLAKMRDASKDGTTVHETETQQQQLGNRMESEVELSSAGQLAAQEDTAASQGPTEQETREAADRSGASSLERRSYGGRQTEDEQKVKRGGDKQRLEIEDAPQSDATIDQEFETTGGAQLERKTAKNRANMDGTQERAEEEEREARIKQAGAQAQQVTGADGFAASQTVHDPMAIDGVTDRSFAAALTPQGILDGQLDGNAVPKDIADAARSMLQMDSAGNPTEKQKAHKTLPPDVGAALMLPSLKLAEGRDEMQPLEVHDSMMPWMVGEMAGSFAAE